MEYRSAVTWDRYQVLTGDLDGDGCVDIAWYDPVATNRIFVGVVDHEPAWGTVPRPV